MVATVALPSRRGAAQSVRPEPAAAPRQVDSDLLNAMEQFISTRRLRERPDLAVHTGIANVPVPISDPNWINARVLTFNQALLAAQGDAIRTLNSSFEVDTINRLYQAANLEPPAGARGRIDGPDAVSDLARRIIGVARGRLDAELRELGINPEEFTRQPEPQRHLQLQKGITTRAVVRASGSVSGFQTATTFEGDDGRGNYTIGVVLVGSQRSRDVAAQIAMRRPFAPDPERAGDPDALLADRNALLDQFGLRLEYDREGLPLLLSFGQAGAASTGSNVVAAQMASDVARRQAEQVADSQIVSFIRASAGFESTSELGQQVEMAARRMADGFVEQGDPVTTFANRLDETLRRRSDVQNLAGITTRLSWVQDHPVAKRPVYGVVRAWSAAAARNAEAFRTGRPQAPAAPSPNSPGGVRGGRDMLNQRDF